jgi:hypothetical protein
MRDHSTARKRHHIPRASDQILIQQEVVRDFNPGDIDLDELAEAIRLLLKPVPAGKNDTRCRHDLDLLSSRRRATHVVGAETP